VKITPVVENRLKFSLQCILRAVGIPMGTANKTTADL